MKIIIIIILMLHGLLLGTITQILRGYIVFVYSKHCGVRFFDNLLFILDNNEGFMSNISFIKISLSPIIIAIIFILSCVKIRKCYFYHTISIAYLLSNILNMFFLVLMFAKLYLSYRPDVYEPFGFLTNYATSVNIIFNISIIGMVWLLLVEFYKRFSKNKV